MTDLSELDALVQVVIAERGGPGAFSSEQMAIVRPYARALDAGDASAIEKLSGLLPKPKLRASETTVDAAGPPPELDLSRLSDAELRVLQRIMLHGCSKDAELVDDNTSPRLVDALAIVDVMDEAFENRMVPGSVLGVDVPTVADGVLEEVAKLVRALCWPLLPSVLFPSRTEILPPDGGKMRDLMAQNEWLREQLRELNAVISGRFTPARLRAMLAQLEAPIHNESPAAALSNMVSGGEPYTGVGDHPGWKT